MYCSSAIECKGPIWVSITFMVMLYLFLFAQALTKFYLYHFTKAAYTKDEKKLPYNKFKYESDTRLKITLDRTPGNTLEQAIPFLMGLWLSALYVSPETATRFGWLYICSRAIYPVCFYYGVPWLLVSTVPGYLFIFMLWKDVALAAM